MKKRSFFERLTGSVNIDEDEMLDTEEEEETTIRPRGQSREMTVRSLQDHSGLKSKLVTENSQLMYTKLLMILSLKQ